MYKIFRNVRGVQSACLDTPARGRSTWQPLSREQQIKWIMRVNLTTVMILVTLLQVSAASFGQRLTMKESSARVDKVIREIKKQTGYDVLLITPKLKSSTVVAANFENASLDQVMHSLLAGRSLDYTIEKKTIIIRPEAPSFLTKVKEALGIPIIVSGRVIDSAGVELPGASIKIKDKVIKSDSHGEFSFSAQKGDVVTISFVGYQTTSFTVFEGIPFQVIKLQSTEGNLQEVIVNTGYQRISKERSTGSFDFIDNKKFNEQVGTTVLERLAGIANSVDYNKSATGDPVTGLTIRGISTINGGRSPLIVVDNFPYNGDLSNINPNDVENITILKDAAASSIWGAKAGNGVIVITTKKGKFGQKMQVNVNSNVSLVTKPDLFSMKIMSPAELIDVQKDLFSGSAYSNKENDIYSRPYLPPVIELLIKARDGQISEAAANTEIEDLKKYDARSDISKYLYKQGVNQQYALGISGGSTSIAYRLGAGYDYNTDNLGASFKRVSLSSINTFRPLKDLELSAGFNFTQGTNHSGRPSYADLVNNGLPVYGRLIGDQGQQVPVARYRGPFIDTLGGGKLLDWHYYPLEDYQHSYSNQNLVDLVLNTSMDYRMNKIFKLNLSYQYEKQRGNNVATNDVESYYTRDLINQLTQIPSDGSSPVYPVPRGSIVDFNNPSLTSHQARALLNFDYSWGENKVVGLAGGEIRTATLNQLQNRVYGYDANTSVTAPVDNVNFYPNIISGFGQGIPYVNIVSSQLNRFVSAFANAAYTYRDRYTISASARRDASNIFGATTNNRWKPLWSAGAGWEISKEDFYSSESLPYLRMRGSYGYSGNVNASIVGVTTVTYLGTDYFSQQPNSNFSSFNNPDLRWESVGIANLGLDFSSAGNRVSGSVEYFQKKTNDLYAPVQTDYTAIPVFQLMKNAASTSGHGIDLQLRSTNLAGAFNWKTDLNFTWYRDRVVDYYSNDTTSRQMAGNSAALSHGGSNAIYGIYSYRWAGLSGQTGAPQGYLNGNVSTDYLSFINGSYRNLIYSGPSTAPFFGNITNTFQWRSLSLTVNVVYKFGYYFLRQSINYSGLVDGNGNADYSQRWQQPGDELRTNVPSFIYPIVANSDSFYGASSVLVEKGDNIRIDYVKANFSISHDIVKRLGLGSVNVYFGARNFGPLWTANKKGVDPDNQLIKPSKVFSFGVNATF